MIYYVEYSREQQKTLSFKSFPESERSFAQAHALSREIELSRQNLQLEIVLLEASNEATVRNTHPRYFGNPLGPEMRNLWRDMPVYSEKLDSKFLAPISA
jgi:hypothetical protein